MSKHTLLLELKATACLGAGVLALGLGAVLAGCSGSDSQGDGASGAGLTNPTAPTGGSADERVSHERLGPFSLRGAGRLELTTDDPTDFYVQGHPDSWFINSTITEAAFFNVRVTNVARRNAHNVQLLVAVPSDIAPGGWAVTVGSPAVVLSQLTDFPESELVGVGLNPHRVYGPHGNAIYTRVTGPAVLAPGETWTVPVQLFRDETDGFEVHFDAVSDEFWNTPMRDVTAQPPMNVGGGERVFGPAK